MNERKFNFGVLSDLQQRSAKKLASIIWRKRTGKQQKFVERARKKLDIYTKLWGKGLAEELLKNELAHKLEKLSHN